MMEYYGLLCFIAAIALAALSRILLSKPKQQMKISSEANEAMKEVSSKNFKTKKEFINHCLNIDGEKRSYNEIAADLELSIFSKKKRLSKTTKHELQKR